MVALVLVALAVGTDNFAAAVAIGVAGVDARTRLRVGAVFGAFEAGMPAVGLLAGHQVAGTLGGAARWVGGGLLAAAGAYVLVAALRARRAGGGAPGPPPGAGLARLALAALALSLDNLVAGFALGASATSVLAGALVIGGVSAGLALAGLELGARLGALAGARADLLAGILLLGVGAAVGAGALG